MFEQEDLHITPLSVNILFDLTLTSHPTHTHEYNQNYGYEIVYEHESEYP